MSTPTFEAVRKFVEPESVALVGVSTRTGPGSFNVLEQLKNFNYKGRIYPVNPKGGNILGFDAYPSISELPETPDVAVIITPREVVPAVVRECVKCGIDSIIIITQGFSDADDEEGQRMNREIQDAVSETSTRIIGPNTLGVMNYFNSFITSFVDVESTCRENGIICQSGIFMAASKDFTGGIGIGIDTGNTADLDFNEILEYMENDDRIKVVNLHIEGIRDGKKFIETASRVSAKKPLLALKTGTSEAGAKAASSHSGSLAGEDHVYNAAFKQAGVIRVSNVDEMEDLNETFLTYNSMPGKRIAVITISGGAGIIAVDSISNNNLEVAEFSEETTNTLQEIFPDWMHPGNPADIWPAGMSKGYGKIIKQSMETILSDPQVDALLIITPAYVDPEQDPLDIRDTIDEAAARYPEKPVATWIFGPYRRKFAQRLREKRHIASYPTAERAMRSLARLYEYLHTPLQKTSYIEPQNIQIKPAAGIIESNSMGGTTTLNEQALDILNAYGIPVVNSATAMSAEDAAQKANKLGFPVVIKVISPQITHKSDIGGVKTNIKNETELYQAWNEIQESVSRIPGAKMLGVLIQQFRPEGIELILGGKRDPQFGPVIIYGLGGIFTELIKDTSTRIAPISPQQAQAMIEETRSYKILQGIRGSEPVDINSIVDALVRVGILLNNHPEINELDINPFSVSSSGALALDARIMLTSHAYSTL